MYFWNKTLHVSDSSSFNQQDQDGTDSVLILFASCQQTSITYTIAVFKREKLLMMDRGTVRNM